MNPGGDPASRGERYLLLGMVLAALVLTSLDRSLGRTGFSAFDEESALNLLQAWREGDGMLWAYGKGSLFRAAGIFFSAALGHPPDAMALPALLGLAAELALLFVWLRPRLGERAALWACLADLVCTATFARGRSMLSPAWLPAIFLAHAVALDHLRRSWHSALWGLSAILWTLDYEGWLLGLAWLGPAWAWTQGRGPQALRRWAAVLGGAALGALIVAGLSQGLAHYAGERGSISWPRAGLVQQVWANLSELLAGSHRIAFSAAAGHPWPAPWIWPLVLGGAVIVWRRFKAAWGLLAVGLLPLGIAMSSAEPHRLSLALLALAAMAGAAAATLWRRPWGPALLLALLAAGTAAELSAWRKADPWDLSFAYGRSRDLADAARWMQAEQPAEGWDLIDGIGPYHDGCFRLMLDQRGVRRQGGRPIALVHADYGQALKGLCGRFIAFDHTRQLPLLLYLPTPAEAPRLKAIQAELRDFQRFSLHAFAEPLRERAEARLRDRSLKDPWARTVYWEAWMQSNVRLNNADPEALNAAIREPLVSGWAFDVAAEALKGYSAEKSAMLTRRAEMADPRRKDLAYRYIRL